MIFLTASTAWPAAEFFQRMFKTKEHQHFSADIPALSGWFYIPRIKTIPNIGAALGTLMNVILPAEAQS